MVKQFILGILATVLVPMTAHAQTGKHVAVGASVSAHEYTNDRFSQGVGLSLLYRLSADGTEPNGISWGPSATVGFSRADVQSDVGGTSTTIGKLQTIPALVGFGPHYRHGRWWTGVSITAGASFNSFTVDDAARSAYQERFGADLQSVDSKTSFAVQPGASLWYDVSSRLGLYGGLFYFYSRPKATITVDGVERSETWNMDYVGISVGAVVGAF
jgi:hypothetical protein